ncbi:MAG: family 16 glycosylhydrolase [Prevotellaceae bacterium]|jgi:beta-glucanase (GH16 family)|nr:family 16 glycosylhydrolase [Prevotellaceae bacterium]
MKKHYFTMLVALFCLGCINLSAQEEYQLVWQDLFDDDALNAGTWNIEVNGNGGGNNELQYYRAENVSVQDGCLVLTAKKETYSGKSVTSGRINSLGKMSFKHGKLEARIRLPQTANGLWPAFWMLGSDIATNPWPACGEIDILEMGNSNGITAGTQDKLFNGACHWGASYNNGNYPNYAKATTNSYSLQDDFHLFTLVWDESAIKMYLDLDVYPYYNMAIGSGTSPYNYFHKPFHILFNLAVGGNFPQIWNIAGITALNADNDYEAKMYVDYVKLYQKGTSDEELHISTTSLKPLSDNESHYSIFPNQTSGEFQIAGPDIPDSVSIFNYVGQVVKVFRNTAVCDISDLPNGNYLVKIDNEKRGLVVCKK